MSAAALESPDQTRPFGVSDAKLGMWLFLASEVMFFTAMVGSYIVLRLANQDTWPKPGTILSIPVLAFNTFVLITSSLTMALALDSVKRGDIAGLKKFLVLTILGGAMFLGIKIADYTHMVHEGFTIGSNLFGSFYYMLTGFHGLHVFGGIVALGAIRVRAGLGHFSAEDHDAVESVGLYWHFVDLVWIVLFAILCLV